MTTGEAIASEAVKVNVTSSSDVACVLVALLEAILTLERVGAVPS